MRATFSTLARSRHSPLQRLPPLHAHNVSTKWKKGSPGPESCNHCAYKGAQRTFRAHAHTAPPRLSRTHLVYASSSVVTYRYASVKCMAKKNHAAPVEHAPWKLTFLGPIPIGFMPFSDWLRLIARVLLVEKKSRKCSAAGPRVRKKCTGRETRGRGAGDCSASQTIAERGSKTCTSSQLALGSFWQPPSILALMWRWRRGRKEGLCKPRH